MDKMLTLNLIVMITGMYLLAGSFILECKNFGSTLVFKVIPFFLGLFTFGRGLQLLGWM